MNLSKSTSLFEQQLNRLVLIEEDLKYFVAIENKQHNIQKL